MKYNNREMKVGSIIQHLNDKTINLIPPFQRGTVWPLKTRQSLISNMIQARPIPAIFLYKEAAGSKFSYNILDGKQRLESLILFVGDKRADLKISSVADYFFKKPALKDKNFKVKVNGSLKSFAELDDTIVRDFREYAISTIEIDLDDENAGIDEVISLFIDINQQGVKVTRFEVIKAMGKDPLFIQVFGLVALKQKRNQTDFYKAKKSAFVSVLKKLSIVSRLPDATAQVDRMWERLTEIALFQQSRKHRAPVQILKSFITGGSVYKKLSLAEIADLRRVFTFLAKLYKKNAFADSKLATDQPQFYTLVTTLISSGILDQYGEAELIRRLIAFRDATLSGSLTGKLKALIAEYHELSARQTTHPSRRERRQQVLVDAIAIL